MYKLENNVVIYRSSNGMYSILKELIRLQKDLTVYKDKDRSGLFVILSRMTAKCRNISRPMFCHSMESDSMNNENIHVIIKSYVHSQYECNRWRFKIVMKEIIPHLLRKEVDHCILFSRKANCMCKTPATHYPLRR